MAPIGPAQRCGPIGWFARHDVSSTALVIGEVAQELSASLLVVGICGRTGLARFMLGSVVQDVLRTASADVLAALPRGT